MIFYPVGDAKKYQGVSVKTNPFFFCGENLPHTLPHKVKKFLKNVAHINKRARKLALFRG